jgi:predicted double-glycine peptidase
MTLDYVRKVLSESGTPQVPSFELPQIAKIVGTTVVGTELKNVRNMNEALEKAIPSVEFDVDFKSHDFKEIEEELAKSRPCIAWLLVRETGSREYWHSVVIRGFDRRNQTVSVNDPQRGQMDMQTAQFIEEWEGTERTLIKLKVGEKIQRKLTEYMEEYQKTKRLEVLAPVRA